MKRVSVLIVLVAALALSLTSAAHATHHPGCHGYVSFPYYGFTNEGRVRVQVWSCRNVEQMNAKTYIYGTELGLITMAPPLGQAWHSFPFRRRLSFMCDGTHTYWADLWVEMWGHVGDKPAHGITDLPGPPATLYCPPWNGHALEFQSGSWVDEPVSDPMTEPGAYMDLDMTVDESGGCYSTPEPLC